MTLKFSFLTLFLLLMGWAVYWLTAVRLAKRAAIAAGTAPPTWLDFYHCDPEGFWISVIGLAVGYWVIPWLASGWPQAAAFIGSTAEDPMNPMAAFAGGALMPLIIDAFTKRFAAMVADD